MVYYKGCVFKLLREGQGIVGQMGVLYKRNSREKQISVMGEVKLGVRIEWGSRIVY